MKKIRKLIIPVAGLGTRFLPVTKTVAKEVLPIIDKPTIQYIVDEARESGIEEIIFITSPYKRVLEDFYDTAYEVESWLEKRGKLKELKEIQEMNKNMKFIFIRQGAPRGTGHAVNCGRIAINNEPFAVAFGDDLVYSKKPAFKQLIEIYEKKDCNVVGGIDIDPKDVSSYGIYKFYNGSNDKIETMIEKPKVGEIDSTFAGLGRYIVKPEIFDELDKLIPNEKGETHFVEAMRALMKTQDFYACRYDGEYLDVGSKFGYLKANIKYALDREDLREDLLKYMKEVVKENE